MVVLVWTENPGVAGSIPALSTSNHTSLNKGWFWHSRLVLPVPASSFCRSVPPCTTSSYRFLRTPDFETAAEEM
jgi:hypothetical protein